MRRLQRRVPQHRKLKVNGINGMSLNTRQKLGFGSLLSVVGSFGIVAGLLMGSYGLDNPWGFLVGFVLGVLGGIGATLSLSGLIDLRSGR